jgi:putative iron-only hydrogenase system regulator
MTVTQSPHPEKRLGVVAIIVHDRDCAHTPINEILHDFAHLIVGRIGLPYRERNLSIISLIVEGSTDEIGAMTGRIGQLDAVTVKTVFVKA